MDKKYNLMQSTGKYQKDGVEKSRWTKIGVMLEKPDGKRSIKLEALPLPNKDGEVWLQVFEDKPKVDGWN
jgi:hypothetical protein